MWEFLKCILSCANFCKTFLFENYQHCGQVLNQYLKLPALNNDFKLVETNNMT